MHRDESGGLQEAEADREDAGKDYADCSAADVGRAMEVRAGRGPALFL